MPELVDAALDWMSKHPYLCVALFLLLFFGGFAISVHIGIDIR